MKDNEVPRYGTHNGIKYTPNRTIVRWCLYCNSPILIQGRGRKPTTCSIECKNRAKNVHWRVWYNSMFLEQKIAYNTKKRQSKDKQDIYDHDSILSELRSIREYEG